MKKILFFLIAFTLNVCRANSLTGIRPYRIFKVNELAHMKNSSEVCLFANCQCQNIAATKLNINCTQTIGQNVKFPSRIDTENFMGFDRQIEMFVLANNNFKQIPDDTFKNLRLECLELNSNSMEKLGTNLFRGIKQLNRLLLRHESNLKMVENGVFAPIKYLLLELDLSFNE